MELVDLTLSIPAGAGADRVTRLRELRLGAGGTAYTGMVYDFTHDSMVGTYIDFPGHIKETDDGLNAATYPLSRLYRVETTVIHLHRANAPGPVGAAELEAAAPDRIRGGGLVINALGECRFDEIRERSVWLDKDAVAWIAASGVHLLVSDIYESAPALSGVFSDLFAAGISTICCPVNLHRLRSARVLVTALPARFEAVTQLPCRVVAEL